MTLPDSNATHFLKQQPKAGDTQPFPSGQITYLAPLPLPTLHPAQDHSHAVGEVTDTYLDFGTGLPQVFGWQMLLGGPFTLFVMITYLLPLISACGALLVGGTLDDAEDFFYGTYEASMPIVPLGIIFIVMLNPVSGSTLAAKSAI